MIYCADFETTQPNTEYAFTDLDTTTTRVWGFGLCPLDSDDVTVGYNMEMFIRAMEEISEFDKECVVYFHNLSFDGMCILDYLMSHGYKYFEGKRSPRKKQFKCLISDMGQWYSLEVRFRKHVVHFRDSLKLLPFKLDTLAKQLKTPHQKLCGTIDYTKDRPDGYIMDETERKYLVNDVLIMVEALNAMNDFNITDKLTIGSKCLDEYKQDMKHNFEKYFPTLSPEQDSDIRKAYKGGWCYCKEPRKIFTTKEHLMEFDGTDRVVEICEGGEVYDVNSLYPYVMHSSEEEPHVYPCGEAVYFTGDEFDPSSDYLYVVRFNAEIELKPDHLPSIQVGNSRFGEHRFLEATDGVAMEFTMTKPDFELMHEQYDIYYIDILDGYYFTKCNGIFDKYIDKWYEVKKTAKNKAVRLFAKLMLNNLYGKFATSPKADVKVPIYEDGKIKLQVQSRDDKPAGYIPVGAYITAYARCKTIRAAQSNYDVFLYADTDSIHCKGAAKGIIVDPSVLGAWKNESSWDVASFIRQKTYCEYTTKEEQEAVEPYWILKACGAPDLCKDRIKHEVTRKESGEWVHEDLIYDENDNIMNEKRSIGSLVKFFDLGMEECGKLMRRTVQGGTVLLPSAFTMH